MNKKLVGAFIVAALVLSIGVGVSFAAPNLGNSLAQNQNGVGPPDMLPVMKGNPHQFKQLKLMYTTDTTADPIVWVHVAGNEVSGFKLCLDPAVEYYYLDVMKLKPYLPIGEGLHPFFVEEHPATSITTSGDEMTYENYWLDRGANSEADEGTVEWLLYHIFLDDTETQLPVFFLRANADGTYDIIDGFQYLAGSGELPLRVDSMPTIYNANYGYLLGTYTYASNDWTDGEGTLDGLGVQLTMTFRTCECDDCLED